MNKLIFAYDFSEITKILVNNEAGKLFKSNLLEESQWNNIKDKHRTELYTPTILMRLTLFSATIVGLLFFVILFALDSTNIFFLRVSSFLLGFALIAFVEKVLIKDKHHFNSGMTEAGIYSGTSLLAFALLGNNGNEFSALIVAFILAAAVAIRYFDIIAFCATIGLFAYLCFYSIYQLGGILTAILPLVFMAIFSLIYWLSVKVQGHIPGIVFDKQLSIIRYTSLFIVYLSGNYFVVSELSRSLMNVNFSTPEYFPLTLIYFVLTALIPSVYLVWGFKKRSLSIIRMGVLIGVLSVLTFQHQIFHEFSMLSVTIWGFLLVAASMSLFRYLKQSRDGFTTELLLNEDWADSTAFALIAGQILGGNDLHDDPLGSDSFSGGGGTAGGAGSSGEW